MKRSFIWFLHIGYWSLYFMFWALVAGLIVQSDTISEVETRLYLGVILGVAILPAIISFYLFYFFLFPKYLQLRKIKQSIIVGLFIALLSTFVGCVALNLSGVLAWSCHGESNYLSIVVMTFFGIVSGVVALIIKGFITWYELLKIKEQLIQKNHETEMALVKSQLDPHFLFNTLNNIDILILKSPKVASEYLNKLSHVIRFMLFESKSELILLSKEIEYIRKYIELQKIRTSNMSYVNFIQKGDPLGIKIAPLVFIPFIENAFKHTSNKKLKDAININLEINSSQLIFTCKNKYDPYLENPQSNGIGNELIKKRLNLIYNGNHQLIVNNSKDQYEVELRIEHDKV